MRTMPPWEANEYFRLPAYQEIAVPSPGNTLLLNSDPMRVAILFGIGIGGAGNCNVAPSSDVTAAGGFAVSNGVSPLLINHFLHGPMVNAEWWGNTNVVGGTTVSIATITLNDWPNDDPHATADVADALANIADMVAALSQRIDDAFRAKVQPSVPQYDWLRPKAIWGKSLP